MSELFLQNCESPSQVPKLCFCCLKKNVTFVNLATCKHFGILEKLCSVKIPNKELGGLLCYYCHAKLKAIYNFKLQAEESFTKLWKRQYTASEKAHQYEEVLLVKEEFNIEYQPEDEQHKITIKLEPDDVTEVKLEEVTSGSLLPIPHRPHNRGLLIDQDDEVPLPIVKVDVDHASELDEEPHIIIGNVPIKMDEPGTSGTSRKRKRPPTSSNIANIDAWIESELEQDFSDVDDEVLDPDFCFFSDHNSDSEQSNVEESINDVHHPFRSSPNSVIVENAGQDQLPPTEVQPTEPQINEKFYYGKNGFKWSADEPVIRNIRSLSHNIINVPRAQPNTYTNLETLWNFFFDTDMIDKVVSHTNQKLAQVRIKYKNQDKPELRDVDHVEMKSFFGLLFYASVFKSNHENVKYIFATDGSGREIFRSIMSQYRFLVLLNCIRFDNIEDRQQRLECDKLAAISELFDQFISNCKKAYVPGAYLSVDEMLVPFRGRCKFIIYMPKKPAKYGLKILLVVDAETFYVYNAYIYCGKDSDGLSLPEADKKFAIPTQSVLRLCKDFEYSNRNVTADNWFSSYELMEQLKARGLTYIGTLKKKKRHIPPEFQASKDRDPESTLHGFTKEFTLVSYVPKKSKAVLLISSMHHTSEIDPETKKPMIILDYNKTKGGVDEVDKKCSNYSCSRRTRRWPLAIFFRMLDLSGVNAFVLYKQCTNVPEITRGRFLQDLARELVVPHLQRRVYNERLPRELRLTVKRILGTDLPPEPVRIEAIGEEVTKKTCTVCPARLKRRTRYRCIACRKPICLGCSKTICGDCADQE